MTVTDTFTISGEAGLSESDFTVTFEQDGAAASPAFSISNEGGGDYQLQFSPGSTGSWWVRVVYETYKFEEAYDVGPIEPESDIPIQHQPWKKSDEKDLIFSDRITVRDGETHRVTLPRAAGKGYSVTVTPEETRGAEISVKKASTFFELRCRMFDTLAGHKDTVVVEYTVMFWDLLEKKTKWNREDIRRVAV